MPGVGARKLWPPNLGGPSSSNLVVGIAQASGASLRAVRATEAKTTGKWYWEAKFVSGSYSICGVGNALMELSHYVGYSQSPASSHSCGIESVGGAPWTHGYSFQGSPGSAVIVGGYWCVAMDVDAQKLWIGNNGIWPGNAPQTGTGHSFVLAAEAIFAAVSILGYGSVIQMNFGASPFSYQVPSGFSPYGAGVTMNPADKDPAITLS